MDFENMTQEERVDLLNKAKDAYYNTGEEILSDAEYDELEALTGLENKNYVGSQRGNYDVRHAFIMGSLSKTQVKENKDGSINWQECATMINNFLNKANGAAYFETTPKLDGCSFSAEFKNRRGKAYLSTVATRGNGKWGTDIRHWFEPILKTEYWSKINEAVANLCEENSNDILCIRGEVLVRQSDFSNKYTNSYVNPRAFTAGMLGLKFDDIDDIKKMQGNDLHFVCYDYRLVTGEDYEEYSWMNPKDPSYAALKPYLGHIGELPDPEYCQVYSFDGKFTAEDLQEIYDIYDDFRKNKSEYALDGIVFKPNVSARQYNLNRERPVDCIAMKFLPMINSTEIIDFIWSVGKTGEYYPTAKLKPFKMDDGKMISKASAHNYGWIKSNNCGIGSIVRVSLAGDIIPFIYEIVNHKNADDNNINLPIDTYVIEDPKSHALHLMKKFEKADEDKNKFVMSADTLNINLIGPAAASDIYDMLHNDIDDLTNVIYLMNDNAYQLMFDKMGRSKSVINYVNSLKQYAANITLEDIIRSFNFKSCGKRASVVCAQIIAGHSYNVASLPGESYKWALNPSSREYYLVMNAMDMLGVEPEEEEEINEDKIPIIMTGSPDVCTSYPTKSKWLQAHPQYVETTSWKDCQILFCDDLNSTTSKMQKAKKAGIEIRLYDEGVNESNEYKKELDFNEPLF